MSLESALYSYLTGKSAITSLTGAGNLYAGAAPEGAGARRLVFNRISQRRFDHLKAAGGLVRSRVQIDNYGTTPDDAIALGEAVRGVLHGFIGAMGSEALDVRWVTIDDWRNSYEPPHDGSSVGVHRASQDYIFVHCESVPTF